MGRVICIVPGCRRTADQTRLRAGDNEWICQPHWSAVPLMRRKAYHRARRLKRPVVGMIWRQLKEAAVQAAAGL